MVLIAHPISNAQLETQMLKMDSMLGTVPRTKAEENLKRLA
jgi:hypothetical protein